MLHVCDLYIRNERFTWAGTLISAIQVANVSGRGCSPNFNFKVHHGLIIWRIIP